jgi:hypothetical protein
MTARPDKRTFGAPLRRIPLAVPKSIVAALEALNLEPGSGAAYGATLLRGLGNQIRPGTGVGLGKSADPFSAQRYRAIQRGMSHVTLAQTGTLPRRFERRLAEPKIEELEA